MKRKSRLVALGSYFSIRIFLYLARDLRYGLYCDGFMVVSNLLAHFAVVRTQLATHRHPIMIIDLFVYTRIHLLVVG